MKGINVRKIAAVAGAITLGLSAVAFADVVYGNSQLVDQNGQPTVKIYVGSSAAISDGIAAANIAAKIANEAYKSSTLTAQVSGTPTCTVGSGTSGSGTCSIVESSKKVTLAVTVPGTVAGAYTFDTLISDYIDKTLENRNGSRSEDYYSDQLTASDTSGSVTSPLRGVYQSATTGTGANLYRIGSDQFTGFADNNIVDNQATGTTYTQTQAFWVGTTGLGVTYDSGSSYKDVVVNKYSVMAYSTKFTGNDYGLSVCTGDLNTNSSDDWASCDSGDNARTDRHRLSIEFLGSNWIISEMNDPALSLTSSTAVVNGGQIELAKEAKYGIINVGQSLDAGTFKVRLSDISVATGASNLHPAILDILDANDQVVGQIQVDPGTTYTFTQSGTTDTVKVHVYNTAPGFTLSAKWAEMAIYNDEITLKDGGRYNLVSSSDPNQNFYVSLLWKNRDYTGSPGENDSSADSLREIVLYNTDDFTTGKTNAGDSFSFPATNPAYKLTYNGLDLTSDDYVSLAYSALSPADYPVAALSGDSACAATSGANPQYLSAKFIQISTAGNQYLGGSSTNAIAGGVMVDKAYFDPIGLAGSSNGYLNGTYNQTSNSSNWSPKVFWKLSGRNCYNWNNVSYTTSNVVPTDATAIRFDKAGDNTAALGEIFFTKNVTMGTDSSLSNTYNGAIMLQEDAGYYGTTSNNPVYTMTPFIANGTSSTGGTSAYAFEPTSTTTQYVYSQKLDDSWIATEPTVITERGSQILSVGTNDFSMKVADKVGQASFTFATSSTSSNSSSNAEQYTMGVGESKVFGGVTVTVQSIDATAGSCSVLGANGAPACTVDSTSLSAVVMPNNAASVVVNEPYTGSVSGLVAKDTDGSTANTAILVGGPAVNTMTAAAVTDAAIDFQKEGVVVKEIGNKIVVAGYTADDTLAAADLFIKGIQRQ